MAFKIDTTTDTSFDELDEGGMADKGMHTAVCVDTNEDDAGNQVLIFKIDAGPSKGCKLYYRVFDPEQGADEKKQEGRRKVAMAIMKRTGAMLENEMGRVDFEPQWLRALNKRFVVDVEHEEYPEGSGKMSARIKLYGILTLDSSHVKPADRRRLGLPLLPEQVEAERQAASGTAGPKPRRGGKSGSEPVGAGAGGGSAAFTPPSDF